MSPSGWDVIGFQSALRVLADESFCPSSSLANSAARAKTANIRLAFIVHSITPNGSPENKLRIFTEILDLACSLLRFFQYRCNKLRR
jgi:hypothetical protein